MTLAVTHKFVSLKGDGTDATLVRPSNWNDTHQIALAAGNLIGRPSVDVTGYASEIPLSAYIQSLLNTADFATLASILGLPTTGDGKITFKTSPDTGWVLMNDGSIGDASSGGTARANADCQALFTLFYNNMNDTWAPIQTSAGAATTRAAQGTAATAWGAHCRMLLPRQLGRAIIGAGAGSGLTSRALGEWAGEETHALIAAEVPDHTHSFSGSGSGSGVSGAENQNHSHSINFASQDIDRSLDHTHTYSGSSTTGGMNANNPHSHGVSGGVYGGTSPSTTGGGAFGITGPAATITIGATDINHGHGFSWSGTTSATSIGALNHTHSIIGTSGIENQSHTHNLSVSVSVSGTTGSAGYGSGAHNNMQPYAAWNVMVKL